VPILEEKDTTSTGKSNTGPFPRVNSYNELWLLPVAKYMKEREGKAKDKKSDFGYWRSGVLLLLWY
jgi:hypothetical protein